MADVFRQCDSWGVSIESGAAKGLKALLADGGKPDAWKARLMRTGAWA